MTRKLDLQQLQQWLIAVISDPAGVEHGARTSAARQFADTSIEEVIEPSNALTSSERLEVYGNGYFVRLMDCMSSFFPALVHTLGEDVFNDFAIGYLVQHPPHSYTLNRLADNFIQYLHDTRPAQEAETEIPVNWPEFVIDLARLEYAIDDVFDGPGIETGDALTPEDLQGVEADGFPQLCLELTPCVRLLHFTFPVNDYYSEFRTGGEPDLPRPAETFLALSRLQFIVHRFALTYEQYLLLTLLDEGATVGEAIQRVAENTNDVEQLVADLQDWFFTWSANGFFRTMRAQE